MKNFKFLAVFIILFGAAGLVAAQDNSSAPGRANLRPVQDRPAEKMMPLAPDTEKRFPEIIPQVIKERIKSEEAFKNREEATVKIQALREELKVRKDEARAIFEEKREALKDKLVVIRDVKKQETVSRLNENINELNEKKTGDFDDIIARLEGVWARVKAKSEAATGADSEIENLLNAAKSSLSDQAGKVYELKITTENNLKTDIGQVRQTLQSDLKAVQEKIGAVKEKLRDILSASVTDKQQ